jgi:hypothetical protein
MTPEQIAQQRQKIADIEKRWNSAEEIAWQIADTFAKDHNDPAYQEAERMAEDLWNEFTDAIETLRRETGGQHEDALNATYAAEYSYAFRPSPMWTVDEAHQLAMRMGNKARQLHLLNIYRANRI